ncbi:hypothetical protein E1B28_004558 [Marasmius oreades]|uniref:Uncharacterized protein n=1 Tax=Marasmius oreades TaxID=181124 RepID=A0A9P7UYZ1_9AGAR|nr:uncharacterized protein E1B28_004558 [Marasmius oreades]KAG7097186.1 hypothetical protein E1B28_004558 [Marasmius oreades]
MNAASTSSLSQGPSSVKDLISRTLNTNQAHQYALTKYAERLTEELKEVDALLKIAEHEVHEDDPLDEDIQIMGAIAAKSPINPADLLKTESPFYEEATSRNRYVSRIQYRPMKAKEVETLVSAVSDEFRRLRAVDFKNRGLGIPDKSEPVDLDGNTDNINWGVVAEKVSDVATFKRMPDECKVKWLGHKQPRLNHSEWSEPELKKLQQIVGERQKSGAVDWTEVAEALGTNRVPIECMRNSIPRPRHAWTPDADKRLVEAVELYGHNNWGLCALYVSEHCTPSQCYGRYTRYLDPQINRSEWTTAEDEKLRAAVVTFGPSWKEISAFIPGRTNEQCRERYSVVNNTTGKRAGAWDNEEDRKLLEAVSIHGHKWRMVSAYMQNTRTEGQCRNHYAILQRAMGATAPSPPQEVSSVAICSPSTYDEPFVPADLPVNSPSQTTHTPSSGQSQPRNRQLSTKEKGKSKANVSSQITVASAAAPVDMDLAMPMRPAITASQSRPRPKPKPIPVRNTNSTNLSADKVMNPNPSISGIPSSREGEGNSDTQDMSIGTVVTSVGTRQSRRLANKTSTAASYS